MQAVAQGEARKVSDRLRVLHGSIFLRRECPRNNFFGALHHALLRAALQTEWIDDDSAVRPFAFAHSRDSITLTSGRWRTSDKSVVPMPGLVGARMCPCSTVTESVTSSG